MNGIEAPSKADVLKWSTRFMELHKQHMPGWDGECEIRQMFGEDDEPCGRRRKRASRKPPSSLRSQHGASR
jgi:hypothetical protein